MNVYSKRSMILITGNTVANNQTKFRPRGVYIQVEVTEDV